MFTGKKIKLIELENAFWELCFDAEAAPVNVFNEETISELTVALDKLEAADQVKGLLVTSTKSVFVAGADITEFTGVFSQPKDVVQNYFATNNSNFNRFESFSFPSVVAINGFALGGGLEVCLACDYRVMSSKAKVGLPETGLGIIPGWGGTVRAPRLAGLQTAMEWVASGKHYNAAAALEAGIIDRVAEPDALRAAALDVLREAVANDAELAKRRAQKTAAIPIDAKEALQLAEATKANLLKRTPHLLAPAAAIDLLAASASAQRDQALSAEASLFADLAATEQARALVGNFLNEQYLSKVAKGYAKRSELKVSSAAVIGAGIMGGGIAYQNAINNIPVAMKDINQQALDLGMSEADGLLSKTVKRGRMTEEKKSLILGGIKPTLDIADVSGAQIIVEAVVENPKVKDAVLTELEENIAENAVLASNTSSILISRMAKTLKRPENFAGLHFFNPVHAMPLVEVIRGEKTSDETISALVAYVLALGKKPVVVNDCPAFLVNRVLFPYLRGFEQLVVDGASYADVDKVMETWGWPMGPAYLSDVVGIDTIDHCLDVLADDIPDRMSRLEKSIINVLYKADRFGQKNNRGFYQYEPDDKGRLNRMACDDANNKAKTIAGKEKVFSEEEIVIRCMLPMAIEMARCLEEEIVASAAEADIALLYGLGFPAFRGGVVRWMDEVGVKKLCQWSDQYAELGAAYVATAGMREKAERNETYY